MDAIRVSSHEKMSRRLSNKELRNAICISAPQQGQTSQPRVSDVVAPPQGIATMQRLSTLNGLYKATSCRTHTEFVLISRSATQGGPAVPLTLGFTVKPRCGFTPASREDRFKKSRNFEVARWLGPNR